MLKNLCQKHHLYYRGERCPLCESERIESYASKFGKYGREDTEPKERNDREIEKKDLERLLDKFGATDKKKGRNA